MLRRSAVAIATASAVGILGLVTAVPASADSADAGQTRLSFDAGPEPIYKNRKLSLSGRLSVGCTEDYIDGFMSVIHRDSCKRNESWHRLGWKRIDIFFQPKGHGRWKYVDTVKTRSDGSFRTSATASWSGTWRAVFRGERGLGSSQAGDYVKVIRSWR